MAITPAQQIALEKLTTERANKLFSLIDLIADMDYEGLSFLRRIGDAEDDGTKPLKDFLNRAKPSTLKFLTEATDEQIALLKSSIRILNALIIIGSAVKWGLISLATMFAAITAIKNGWFDWVRR